MQVSLSGHHVEITDSMRNYVNEKVDKLDRHFDQALDIHIVLTVEKLRHKAEATLHVSGSSPATRNLPGPRGRVLAVQQTKDHAVPGQFDL